MSIQILEQDLQFGFVPDKFYWEAAGRLDGLPLFPAYRPLILADKKLFERMLYCYSPEISELTFTNLFAWRNVYHFSVSRLFGYLIVIAAAETEAENEHEKEKKVILNLLDPIGPLFGKKMVIEGCFQRTPPNTTIRFIRLPHTTASMFAEDAAYLLTEDRDNSDYVYSREDLSLLKGSNFDGKRNLIKRFKESTTFQYLPLTGADITDALAFVYQWCRIKGCESSENSAGLLHERQALVEMLLNFHALDSVGGMIKVAGKIVALILGERLNSATLVVHIEKADTAWPGIYQAINMFFSQSEGAKFTFINREQDLGIPGLRKAKESYHPHHMVEQFTLARSQV